MIDAKDRRFVAQSEQPGNDCSDQKKQPHLSPFSVGSAGNKQRQGEERKVNRQGPWLGGAEGRHKPGENFVQKGLCSEGKPGGFPKGQTSQVSRALLGEFEGRQELYAHEPDSDESG